MKKKKTDAMLTGDEVSVCLMALVNLRDDIKEHLNQAIAEGDEEYKSQLNSMEPFVTSALDKLRTGLQETHPELLQRIAKLGWLPEEDEEE